MAFKINKGSELGKYYYQKHGITYGPLPVSELLNRIDANTLVYFDGSSWDNARNIPELKKFFVQAESNENKPNQAPPPIQNAEKKSNSATVFFVVLLLLIGIVAYLFYNENNKMGDASAETLIDTTMASPADSSSIIEEDVLYNALSQKQIDESQLQRLSYADIVLYQNELLARHKYIFEDPAISNYYSSKTWYSPESDFLVATAGFSDYEKYNFDLLENKKNEIANQVRDLIKRYYSSFSENTFDATVFYAERVNHYITQNNISSHRINELYSSESKDFVNPKFKFSDPIELSYEKGSNGISYYYFTVYYGVFRPSKNKYQTCVVKIKLGLDLNYKFVHYEEVAIENLRFSDYDEFNSVVNSSSTNNGTWMVILGSFSNESDALQLNYTLSNDGIESEVLRTDNFQNLSKNLYFVSGGKNLNKEQATKLASDISAIGYQAYIKDAGIMQ
jgi:hypothetical protein